MQIITGETQARRYVHKPKKEMESYRVRVELAKEAAACGLGHEDLQVMFKLDERDARQIVFGGRT